LQSNGTAQRPARRGSKAYLVASFAAQLCALARYTLLARLLGPEQLGIAVALILTAQFFEAVTESGGDRFLVQDRQGDEPDVQRLVHLVSLLRGLLCAAALAALSVPLARFYGEPALRTGFLLLAAVPLIVGCSHLDYRRIQRRSDFRGETRALLASELASLVVTGIAAFLTRDFTAILYGLVTRSAVIVLVSHMTSERRYGAGFVRAHSRRLAAFGIPLMLNGILLFLGSQGDRLLIGKQVGLTELGHYSAALLLILYPSSALQRFLTAFHLPLISAPDSSAQRAAAADRLGGRTMLLALAMMLGYALLAPAVITLFFGPQFAIPHMLVALIGILQSLRFLRLWPVTAALSIGRSGLVLASNLVRLLALPLAILSHNQGLGLEGIVIAFALAELLALLITLPLLNRLLAQRLLVNTDRVLLFTLIGAAAVAWASPQAQESAQRASALAALSLGLLLWLYFREKRTGKEALAMISRMSGRAILPLSKSSRGSR
jgi:O-antigen/teichoic acid export membrane protein